MRHIIGWVLIAIPIGLVLAAAIAEQGAKAVAVILLVAMFVAGLILVFP